MTLLEAVLHGVQCSTKYETKEHIFYESGIILHSPLSLMSTHTQKPPSTLNL